MERWPVAWGRRRLHHLATIREMGERGKIWFKKEEGDKKEQHQ
jgi:hypothetical protein